MVQYGCLAIILGYFNTSFDLTRVTISSNTIANDFFLIFLTDIFVITNGFIFIIF